MYTWEDSRMTDKMSWEQYEWPKHQEALKEMDADQVESEILHGKIDALEADNQRLREALEKIANWNDGIQADISDCPERIAKQALEG